MLPPVNGVPMSELEGKVSFFEGEPDRGKFKGFIRMSPNLFRAQSDGDLILELLREAESAPVARPVDAKKLARRPFFKAERRKGKETIATVVTVPESEQGEDVEQVETVTKAEAKAAKTRHTEIQYQLLLLGAELGLDLWVARNDRVSGLGRGRCSGVCQGLLRSYRRS